MMPASDEFDYLRAREQQRRALQSAILEAAASLLADQGLEGMSVRAIAGRVGASTKVIYSQFGGKPGIIEALYRDGFDRLAESVRDAAMIGGTAPEQILNIAEAYRAFATGFPAVYELMFGPRVRELLPTPSHRDPVVGASQIIADILRAGQTEGTIRAGDIHRQTKFLWSALHATVSLELMDWFTEEEAIDNHRRLVSAAVASLHT
jgi:AcrR family transcriptional regulator